MVHNMVHNNSENFDPDLSFYSSIKLGKLTQVVFITAVDQGEFS